MIHSCVCVSDNVCLCYIKTVSQREKINDASVTGTSPSAFAHMHTLIPPTDTSFHHIHKQYVHTFLHTAQHHSTLSAHGLEY